MSGCYRIYYRKENSMGTSKDTYTLKQAHYDLMIFDLDGVITQSAGVHARAWKRMFDEYLSIRESRTGKQYEPFDIKQDYYTYVDGKPRYEGVESFLESRDIHLDYGSPDDSPETETICGLGNRKNEMFQEVLEQKGVKVYDTSIEFIRQLRDTGFKTAVVSSSKNCRKIVEKVGVQDLFDTMVDGIRSEKENLKGKPAPDIFLAAAHDLGVAPERAVVIEDALSGVEAGNTGNFGYVVGIDRGAGRHALEAHGADVVVSDLKEIHVEDTL